MFQQFDSGLDPRVARRFAFASLAALSIALALGMLARSISASGPLLPRKKSVDVFFRPPPPPPPPAKLEKVSLPKPPLPPKASPVVAAPAPMVAPVEVPKKPVPEAEKPTVAAINVAPGGTGSGVVAPPGGELPAEPDESAAPRVAISGPMNLPEEAEPPEASDDNAMPEYPEVARSEGRESVVILKVVIEKDGSVGRIQVMKGEEPFLQAALAAVQQWRYSPAQLDGAPIAVYRIVKIPFRLRS